MKNKSVQIKSKERVSEHGEVYTDEREVNAMLNMVNSECNKLDSIFLEPACGNGNFLVEILNRKLKLIDINYLDESLLSVVKTIYGIDILKDNCLEAKERLRGILINKYSSIKMSLPDNDFIDEMNCILDRNIICGDTLLSKKDDGSDIIFFNWKTNQFQKLLLFKPDVIIMNPPYQFCSDGKSNSFVPAFNHFINMAIELNPKYIVSINPSRWFKGGKGLNSFRSEFIVDTRIKEIHDFEISEECFDNVYIDGGVNYFLWDRDYCGPCNYYFKPKGEKEIFSRRYLKNDYVETVIRDYRQLSIIQKTVSENNMDQLVFNRNPFGVFADLFNNPEKYPAAKLNSKENTLIIFGVKGFKGASKRISGTVSKDIITKNIDCVNTYKLLFSKAYRPTTTIPPKIIECGPGEICTETFLMIGPFNSEEQRNNCLSYMNTKFFRFLLQSGRTGMNNSPKSFSLIPLQSFSKSWTDAELYNKYNLTKEEINFIEKSIKKIA